VDQTAGKRRRLFEEKRRRSTQRIGRVVAEQDELGAKDRKREKVQLGQMYAKARHDCGWEKEITTS